MRRAVVALLVIVTVGIAVSLLAARRVPTSKGPRGPQSSISCPSGSVSIAPGQSWQSAVNANASGTTFCIHAGTHSSVSSLAPKNNDKFIGEPGAVVDGGNSIAYFINSGADGVTVENLVIQHFKTPLQDGAIEIPHGSNWFIAYNNISYNYEVAVYWGGSGNQIRNNIMNYNGREAYACSHGDGGIMDNNEIAYNNTRNLSTSFEAGGGKCGFAYTNLVVSHNWVHHNKGPGLWTDTDNKGFIYENNLVENNTGQGIDDEVSCHTTIRYNTIRYNGNQWGWHGPMGIWLANSANDDVYGNILVNNGMMAVEQDRNDTPYTNCGDPNWHTRNNHFHDNTVTLSAQGQQVGIDEDNHDTGVYSGSNWFQNNHYTVPPRCSCWRWGGNDVDRSRWGTFAQD